MNSSDNAACSPKIQSVRTFVIFMKLFATKRDDLQGIRGLAIVAVLGFHFYPEWIPNGYLGVDQFFVLSGFLMCMLLQRASQEEPCSLLGLFYSRRFKRILPLYLLLIGLSLLALYSFFPDTAVETNQQSAVYALLFMSNRPKTVQEDYFQMLESAVDIFTHTWSLSVEIQFYLIIPIIFLFCRKLSENLQYVFYFIVSVCSFVFFSISPETVAFNSVFARIWQFVIGLMVYSIAMPKIPPTYEALQSTEESEDDENKKEEPQSWTFLTYSLLIIIIIVVNLPSELPSVIVRPMITITTGILMLISEGNMFLSNRVLTYIGDISYTLYLVHWPIYAYWKLTADGDETKLVIALVSSIIIATVIHETFEKWYLRLSSTSIGVLVITLFVLNVAIIQRTVADHAEFDGVTRNMTVDDAIKMNIAWDVNDCKNLFVPTCDYETEGPSGWCRHNGLSPNGKYKFAIIGNSWTANHAKMFYEECSAKAKSILQGSFFALYPKKTKPYCADVAKQMDDRIQEEHPDFAFVINRYVWTGNPLPKNVTSFDKDPMYRIMKKQMFTYLSSIKYKLYIMDAIPIVNRKYVPKLAVDLKNGVRREKVDKKLADVEKYEMARKRNAQLVKDCKGRCVLIDYVPEFYNKTTGTFQFFDEKGFSYFNSINHLSPHGIEHVRHVWTDICATL